MSIKQNSTIKRPIQQQQKIKIQTKSRYEPEVKKSQPMRNSTEKKENRGVASTRDQS